MAVPYINPITSTPVHRTVNGFDLEGRIWNVRPHQISDADVSARADAYRARNGYNGNPNTDPGLTGAGLDLFATPWPYAFSQYALADRNWNVVGSIPWRSSQASTPDMTTRNHFWGHVWTHIEGLTE